MIIISACLLGVGCRYDGAARPLRSLSEEIAGRALLPVCPEELGGLATPRLRADIEAGADGQAVLEGRARVLREDGADVTEAFVRGAEIVAQMARERGVTLAYLKSKSPSCGAGRIYVDGRVAPGWGVAAAALRRAGVRVVEADGS